MKKIATILLAVLLFCSCGGTNRDYNEGWDLPPKKLFDVIEKNFSEEKEESITFFAKNEEEYEISYDLRFRFQKQEGESWILIKPLSKEEITEEFVLNSGERKEGTFVFEDIFGKLPAGNYRVVVTSFQDNGNRNQWYEHYYFEIEEKNPSEKAGPESLDVTAESHGWNRACGIKIFNNSDREILLSAMWELYYETDGKFEKLDYVRGIGYDKTMLSIAPGESYDLSSNTEGAYGLLPIGKYRIDCRIVFDNDAGFENEQTVSGEFEITGLEKESTSFIWDKTAELSEAEITITFRNDKGNEIRYGEDYFIQKPEGEDWITVEPLETPSFDTVLYTLDETGDKFVEWKTDLSLIYGELPAGSYRLVKTFFTDADNYINGKHYAFFEFEIE